MGWYHSQTPAFFWLLHSPIILILLAWDVAWKAVAMWKAARQNQLYWFIAIAILNTVGILPIIYILFFQKKGKSKAK